MVEKDKIKKTVVVNGSSSNVAELNEWSNKNFEEILKKDSHNEAV